MSLVYDILNKCATLHRPCASSKLDASITTVDESEQTLHEFEQKMKSNMAINAVGSFAETEPGCVLSLCPV
jgi:hypothetical protein